MQKAIIVCLSKQKDEIINLLQRESVQKPFSTAKSLWPPPPP